MAVEGVREGSKIFSFHNPDSHEGYINRVILTFVGGDEFKVEAYETSPDNDILYHEYFKRFEDALQVFNNLVQAVKNLPIND